MKKTSQLVFDADDIPVTLIVGIYAPGNAVSDADDYFNEFASLVDTLEVEYEHSYFTKLRSIDKTYLLTKGKLQEVADLCQQFNIERVIFSEKLSPLQHRKWEDLTNAEVMDREQLILEIFKRAATSAEGKLQVEMAELEVMKSRMAGRGEEFSQQLGLKGGKGPGETYKEKLKRFLANEQHKARKRLDTLQRSRDTQRKQRLASNIPLICLVGYTNAGKSSLLNLLTKSDVLVEDKLFATLDATTREWFLGPDQKALVSDTVGFISQLPHQLIQAFKSTLDEVRYADILLHVVDISNHGWEDQIHIVHQTLQDIGVENKKELYVFNKVDCVSEDRLDLIKRELEHFKPHVITSALEKDSAAVIAKEVQKMLKKK